MKLHRENEQKNSRRLFNTKVKLILELDWHAGYLIKQHSHYVNAVHIAQLTAQHGVQTNGIKRNSEIKFYFIARARPPPHRTSMYNGDIVPFHVVSLRFHMVLLSHIFIIFYAILAL